MASIYSLLLTYKYLILFPLSIVEGPIITVIAGVFVSMHNMNWFYVYGIVVLGDLIGDALVYMFGRFGGGLLKRHGSKFGISQDSLEKAKIYFDKHHHKAVVTSKLVHGIGVSGLAAAGLLKIPYLRFMRTCLMISLAQCAVFLVIGIVFGHAYQQIKQYLDYFAAIISSIVLIVGGGVVFFVVRKRNKKEQ